MKKTFYYKLLITCLFTIGFLCSCGSKNPISEEIIHTSSDGYVCGVDETSMSYCITDYGMLYAENCTIKYYDFETNRVFILCDKANCSHQDKTCNAWYETPSALSGLALYQDACYMFRRNYISNTYDFVKTDFTGSNCRTIVQLDIGTYNKNGSWILSGIENVHYCGDMAWYVADYTYSSEDTPGIPYRQIAGIHLSTGSIVTINEPTFDGVNYSLEAISEHHIILKKQWSKLELLSESDFNKECEKGTFGNYFNDSEESYYDYYHKWYPLNSNQITTILLYTIKTGEMTVLEEFPATLDFNDDGYVTGTLPRYSFNGNYRGKFLCSELNRSANIERVFLWDVEKNTQTDVLSIQNGGIKLYGNISSLSVIFDESDFLYVTYNGEESMNIYKFDLDTMESSSKLTEEPLPVTMQVLADSQNMFIIKKYNLTAAVLGKYSSNLYKISKEDYYNGNFDKAVRLKL